MPTYGRTAGRKQRRSCLRASTRSGDRVRIGVDLGGTKIEVAALGHGGQELARHRIPTPHSSYEDVVRAIAALVRDLESKLDRQGTVGLAIPGVVSPVSGLVKNANSTQLLGHPLDRDVQ